MSSHDIAPIITSNRNSPELACFAGKGPMTLCFQNMNRVGTASALGKAREASECRQLELLVRPVGANWKQANSNSSWLERHDAAVLQRVHQLGQVREQRSRQYVRLPAAFSAKLDDGWLPRRTHREQRSEISIRRHENSTLEGSAIEDRIIVRVLQSY